MRIRKNFICYHGILNVQVKRRVGARMEYSENTMYKAIIENDKKYDGEFFYVVKTVGVYCCPSCRSRIPRRENVLFFRTIEAAREAGFRECKRCHPDTMG